jgi:RNA polymerase sigma factor (sigma-70 family)
MSQDKPCQRSEIELIAACKKQERKAQREIYEKFSPRMFSVCVRYVGDREKAKDILQDGFITVFSKIDSYNGDGSFEGWMRKVFVNTALMDLRKRDVLKETKDIADLKIDTPFIDNVAQGLEGKDIISLIEKMPPGFRTVFNLSVIDGYTHLEIAKHLNITEGASRSQLSRARIWLQERILKMENKR